ncbi:MAG: hypothetical protein Q7S53_00700 [bacterium]|nr:hypothetical protein [bacterium]
MSTKIKVEEKCKTCGSHGDSTSECHNGSSEFFLQKTSPEGTCGEWNEKRKE